MSAAPQQIRAGSSSLAEVYCSSALAVACRSSFVHDHAVHIDMTLPYELLVLECALAGYIKELEAEAYDFESQALPSLERLAVKVCHSVLRCTNAPSPTFSNIVQLSHPYDMACMY